MTTKILYSFTLMSLSIVYIFNFICIITSFNSQLFQYPGFSILGVLSVLLYSLVLIICAIKRDLFFFFLPFIILAFPNVINDFLPSFMMGPVMESRVASFSYITHIDIFLIYGLCILKNHKIQNLTILNLSDFLIFVPIISLFFIATVILSISNDLLSLFAIGNYQIRYIFLFILYLLQIKLNISDFRNIIYGLSFSLFFLLIESSFFTLANGRDHLISGTLAANVFANITAAITLFFVFINPKQYKFPKLYFQSIKLFTIIIGFLILILNGTRMAMLSFFLSGLIYYLITSFKVKNIIQFLTRMFGYGFLFFILILISLQFDKFRSIITIFFDLINFNIKLNEDTASLFARLHMYKVSLNMILENWIIGIGPGRWNFLKYDYGFQTMGTLLTNTLLDPHSDYLSYISQYGIFGLVMISFILIKPALKYLKNPRDLTSYFGLIPFTLLISGLTNSNTLKHQVFAIISMIIFIVHQNFLISKSDRFIDK
ncbi:MAG: hypothetical protein CMF95_00660 [Candidatus Marinimicrobia bacterium]|nr:hypothetical protein [Candidatus Neomarinimicrobiota bacterium]